MAPRPLTDDEKEGLLESLVGGVSGVFTDTGLLFTDRAGFIAGAGSDSPLSQAVRAVSRFQCRLYASDPGRYSASEANYIGDVCDPYLKGLGEDPLPPSLAEPEITGGQCPGVNYDVVVFQNRADNGNPAPPFSVGVHPGPIRSQAHPLPPVDCTSPDIPVNNRYYFVNGQGNPIYQNNSCSAFAQNPRLECTPLGPEPPGGCGDTEPRFEPPRPRPGLPPLGPQPTVFLPGVGDVTVEVGFSPSGQITVGLPDLGVEGTVNIGGGGGDGGGGGGGGGAQPGSPASVSPPVDGAAPGGEGEDVMFGAPPDGRVWTGALVEVTVPTALGNIAGSGPENTVYPRAVGNVSLAYGGGRSKAVRIESRWTDVSRTSQGLQVEGCRVNVLPGVSFRVYPVSEETCPQNLCNGDS